MKFRPKLVMKVKKPRSKRAIRRAKLRIIKKKL